MKQTAKFNMMINNGIGVINRITGLISKKGYKIHSLNMTPNPDDGYLDLILVLRDVEGKSQSILKQFNRLYDVKSVELVDEM